MRLLCRNDSSQTIGIASRRGSEFAGVVIRSDFVSRFPIGDTGIPGPIDWID